MSSADHDCHAPNPAEPIPAWAGRELISADATLFAPVRDAHYWRALGEDRIRCELCFRKCELAPGEAGWCKIRHNHNGAMELAAHGVIAECTPFPTDYPWWKPGVQLLGLAGVSCTSRCSFCIEAKVAITPYKIPWQTGYRSSAPTTFSRYWVGELATLHPEVAITIAEAAELPGVFLSSNEPLLTFEWTYDLARLAKERGLYVAIDSNGFSDPAAIEALAPFVDVLHLGIKGQLEPAFYAKRMRAGVAPEHVKASARAWHAAGVALGISDIIAPPSWMDDERFEAAARRLYGWIGEELGPLTPLWLRCMASPGLALVGRQQAIRPDEAGEMIDRLLWAVDIARECGLAYVNTQLDQAYGGEPDILCHACGRELITGIRWLGVRASTGMADYECHVSPEGICGHCGAQTPIIGPTEAELAAVLAANLPDPDEIPVNRVSLYGF